jgi:hypothetical protein
MVPANTMTLFLISIPLMVLAVALAAVPLILMSRADHRLRAVEATPRQPASPDQPVTAIYPEPEDLAA